MRTESTAYTILFTFLIAFAFVFLLAIANEGTKTRIEQNQEIARQGAILNAFGIAYDTPADIPDVYSQNVKTVTKGGIELFQATVNGETAYAHLFNRNALWGNVYGVLAVNADVSRTLGLQIIDQNETPGLGGRITEPWFKQQFTNEKVENGRITVNVRSTGAGDTNHDNATVDAISGATLTSLYMQDIINAELEVLRNALEANS